jgi:hypothetical protein
MLGKKMGGIGGRAPVKLEIDSEWNVQSTNVERRKLDDFPPISSSSHLDARTLLPSILSLSVNSQLEVILEHRAPPLPPTQT